MSESDLGRILEAFVESEENRASFDAVWSQGRSAYGGLSAAFAAAAMGKLAAPGRPLRSLMVSFVAPLPPGEARADARVLREGKSVTQTAAEVLSGDAVCLQAMGAYGAPREALAVEPAPDFNPTPRERGMPFSSGGWRMPEFLSRFDGCWVDGGLPFSGRPGRHLNLWARHRTDLSRFPAERIVAIADIPPPVVLSHFDAPPAPSSSLTWSLEFVLAPEEVRGEWFYLEIALDAAGDGYTQQSGKIFEESGRLCALTRQCMVYFGPAPARGAA